MSFTFAFVSRYTCDAPGCATLQAAHDISTTEDCAPPVFAAPEGWITYMGEHFCSAACFAKVSAKPPPEGG